jgi:hypothetical protein
MTNKIPQEIEDEYKNLMLFCKNNIEAKDRLNRIFELSKLAFKEGRTQTLEKVKEKIVNWWIETMEISQSSTRLHKLLSQLEDDEVKGE